MELNFNTVDKGALKELTSAENFKDFKSGLGRVLDSMKPQSGGSTKVSLPQVNLLPSEAKDRDAAETARKAGYGFVAAAILGSAGWWAMGLSDANTAEADLATVQATNAELTKELAIYSPVTNLSAQSQSLTTTVNAQTARVVAHDEVLQRLNKAAGNTVQITQAAIRADGDPGACASTDPFNPLPMIGCVTFTGTTAHGQAGAAALISALSLDEWFTGAFVPTINSDQSTDLGATVSGTVGLTTLAYTHQPDPEEAAAADGTVAPATEGEAAQ